MQTLEKGLPTGRLRFPKNLPLQILVFADFKPVIYCANVSEQGDSDKVSEVENYAAKEGSAVISLCASLEEELSNLEADERQMFIEELGLSESGLDKLVKACYRLLGLIGFLTAGEKESRAWRIERAQRHRKPQAIIHSDFERGFIRARSH